LSCGWSAGPEKQTSECTSYFDLPNNRSAQLNVTHSEFDTIITDYSAKGGQGAECVLPPTTQIISVFQF
jgi:hypothetical protein